MEGVGTWGTYHLLSQTIDEEVWCAVEDNQIVGAIGPLTKGLDPWQNAIWWPPYWGVHYQARQKGWGKKLWNIARQRMFEAGAKYILVRNAKNSPAAAFYQAAGLQLLEEVTIRYYN